MEGRESRRERRKGCLREKNSERGKVKERDSEGEKAL